MQQINVDAVMEGNIAQNLGIFGEQLGLLQNETGDMIERITTILANYLAEIESADGEQDAYIVQIDELRYAESGCFSFRINYILGILQDEWRLSERKLCPSLQNSYDELVITENVNMVLYMTPGILTDVISADFLESEREKMEAEIKENESVSVEEIVKGVWDWVSICLPIPNSEGVSFGLNVLELQQSILYGNFSFDTMTYTNEKGEETHFTMEQFFYAWAALETKNIKYMKGNI